MDTIYSKLQDLKNVKPAERRLSKTNGGSTPRKISQGGGPVTGGRPKSQSLYTIESPAHPDGTIRRSSAGQPYKPRRPAPKKPTPYSETGTATFPRMKGRKDNVEEPLVISNPANIQDNIIHEEEAPVALDTNKGQESKTKKGDLSRKRTDSTEAVLLSSTGSFPRPNEDGPTYKTTPTYTESPKCDPKHVQARNDTAKSKLSQESDHATSKSRTLDTVFKLDQTGSNVMSSSHVVMDLSLPDYDDNELPLPQEMVQAVHDERVMGERTEDDFILDPPQKFSQSSFDDIDGEDDLVGVAGGVASGLSFQFDPDEPDTSQDPLTEQAMGGAPFGGREYNGHYVPSDSPPDILPPSERRQTKPKDKTKRKKKKKYGDTKIIKRQKTPANLEPAPGDEYTTSEQEQVASAMGLPNPVWSIDNRNELGEFDDEFGNQFDEIDQLDAMEEDELPNVVLDEDVAALIW